MIPRQLVCAVAAPLILLGGCSGGKESESSAPAGEETPSAEMPVVMPGEAPVATQAAEAAAEPPAAFMQCRACHSAEPGKNSIGPSLAGVVGRKAGTVPGFSYSAALKESGITWNAATLDQWLTGPMRMVPGTRMVISVPDAARRKQLVQYLATLK